MSCQEHIDLHRRRLLLGGGASLALWGLLPRIAAAAGRDPRFLCVVLRGGLDGLSMVAPVGDPDYERLRGPLAIPRAGEGAGLALDNFFVLNARMPFLHGLYQKREALIVHAAATPYRGRSHFDGQDVLESGNGGQGRADDGWLNRALGVLPAAGRVEPTKGLAIGAMVPLVMRGPAPVLSASTRAFNFPLRESTTARLMDLYAQTDPALAKILATGLEIERVGTGGTVMAAASQPAKALAGKPAAANSPAAAPQQAVPQAAQPKQGPRAFANFIETAQTAGRFLTADGGPRIGALSYDGWDTHANEGAVKGLLANHLNGLDVALETLHGSLGAAWKETVIVVVTEFGRTARTNGTEGTDHGTATVALVLGGAVKGGRILADWPGLADAKLYEGRDLQPTRDLRTVFKGVLRDHLGLPDAQLASRVFPDSRDAKPIDGLIGST